jgi:hypothetical protein
LFGRESARLKATICAGFAGKEVSFLPAARFVVNAVKVDALFEYSDSHAGLIIVAK